MKNKNSSLKLLTQSREVREKIIGALVRERREYKTAAIMGALLSFGGFLLLGFVLYILFGTMLARLRIWQTSSFPLWLFFLIYSLVFGALMIYSESDQAKSEYYLGVNWDSRIYNNPFTIRNYMDRRSIFIGLLLLVPNFVRLNLKQIITYLSKGDPMINPTLTAAVLLLAGEKTSGEELLFTLNPIGYSKNSIQHILQFLSDCRWVEINKEITPPRMILSPKGQNILFEAGIYFVPKKVKFKL